MQSMIAPGTPAAQMLSKVKTEFMVLVSKFTHNDHRTIKQHIFKFYQEKHIKVSLFIQDKLQALDGTIHLNFTGLNSVFTPAGHKPGLLKIYKQDNDAHVVIKEKVIPMVHTG